ncbi:MAG: nucleoside hydrolase [Anaerolineae bacterium]|nr:nucleoside hydrolase [Anaerolineae bacterium]
MLFAGAMPGPRAAQTQSATLPIIFDTDMAFEDWIAMLFLLQHPAVEVRAVTIPGTGEAHCDPGVRNAMNLLMLAEKPDIPVACGRETPLFGSSTWPAEWREYVDRMVGLSLPENPNPSDERDAVELLQQTIEASEEPITLVAVGPLTNIAELLQASPAAAEKIAMIYVMGGAVDVAGNLGDGGATENTTAEWNFYADPLAAAQVIESGIPITLVPLDATQAVPITGDFYDALKEDRTTPVAEFVYQELTTLQVRRYSGWFFWDTLTSQAAVDESVVTIEERTLRVIAEEGDEFGRSAPEEGGSRVRLAVDADPALLEPIILNVLNGRDPSASLN